MAQRVLVVAHAATPTTRALVFGDPGDLLGMRPEPVEGCASTSSARMMPGEIRRLGGRTALWLSGPEKACQATAVRLGGTAEPIQDLRDCDFGRWSGKALADVASSHPTGLDAWLRDPYAAPHGGESLAELIIRVGGVLEEHAWPNGRSVAVVTSLVARALLVHALGAAPEVIFRIDMGPLGRALISRSQQTWRLLSLERAERM